MSNADMRHALESARRFVVDECMSLAKLAKCKIMKRAFAIACLLLLTPFEPTPDGW
jgi:hypothetical protein